MAQAPVPDVKWLRQWPTGEGKDLKGCCRSLSIAACYKGDVVEHGSPSFAAGMNSTSSNPRDTPGDLGLTEYTNVQRKR